MKMNLRNTDVDYPNPRRLTAEWEKESMEIELKYVGPSSGYIGAQLDGKVIPRIVACVNACEGMEDPAATVEMIRERANNAFAALGKFIVRYDDDFSNVARSEEIDTATTELSALLGSLLKP